MTRVVWLLELDFGGRVERVAQRALSLQDADGNAVVFREGLGDISVSQSIQTGPSGKSIAITVEQPPGETWAEIALAGTVFAGAEAVIRRWVRGMTTIEQAPVRARGFLEDVEWGRSPAPLVASIEAPPWGDGTRIIPASRAIGPETHPVQTGGRWETDPQVLGALPAVVIGYPGDLDFEYDESGDTYPDSGAVEGPPDTPITRGRTWAVFGEGVPGLLTDTDRFLGVFGTREFRLTFACHQVAAVKCVVVDRTDEVWDVFDVKHALDKQGGIYAYAVWDGSEGKLVTPVVGHAYSVILVDIDGYGGGLRGEDGKPMTGLGEVLVWMLAKMSTPSSVAVQRSHRELLDRFKVQTVINTEAEVWDWVRQEVLPVFAIAHVERDDGGFLAPVPVRPTPGGAVDNIDPVRDGIEVVGSPRVATDKIANHLILEYAGGTKRVVLTDRTELTRGERFDRFCAVSQDLMRRRGQGSGRIEKTFRCDSIEDDATALAVLRDKARQIALPRADIVLEDGTGRLDDLDLLAELDLDPTRWGLPSGQYVVETKDEINEVVRLHVRQLLEDP